MQKRKSAVPNHVDGSTQITRYGVMRDGHHGNQAANHVGGSRVTAAYSYGYLESQTFDMRDLIE